MASDLKEQETNNNATHDNVESSKDANDADNVAKVYLNDSTDDEKPLVLASQEDFDTNAEKNDVADHENAGVNEDSLKSDVKKILAGSAESGDLTDCATDDNNLDEDGGAKTNLIVNYLPQSLQDSEFRKLFEGCGTIKSCKIVRQRVTNYSYGFGFVDFQTHEQALAAIEKLNGHQVDDKKIKVAFARPAGQEIKQANLYVKNVPSSWTEDNIRKVFNKYGEIIQVRVLGNNRGVAFVLYDLRKQAEDALADLNGKKVDGCDAPFEIKFAADKKFNQNSGNQRKQGGGQGGDSLNNSNGFNKGGSNRNNNNNNNNVGGGRGGDKRGFSGNRNGRNNTRFNNDNKGFNNNRNNYFQANQQSQQLPQGVNNFQQNMRLNQQQQQYQMYGNQTQFVNPAFATNAGPDNAVGPIRNGMVNRINRYNPYVGQQQPQQQLQQSQATMQQAGAVGLPAAMMTMNPAAYGYAGQSMVGQYQMTAVQAQPQVGMQQQTGAQATTIASGNPMMNQQQQQINMYNPASNTISMGYAPVYAPFK